MLTIPKFWMLTKNHMVNALVNGLVNAPKPWYRCVLYILLTMLTKIYKEL